MDLEDDFNKITGAITASEKFEILVREVCHMPHVTNLQEFYKIYELEEKAIDKKYEDPPIIAPPTIELFGEVFKKFEEYPANLQKPKKIHPLRERLNSNISKSSPTLNESIGLSSSSINHSKENSSSLLNLNKFDDVPPTASETLNTFVKFQKQLKQLNAELEHHNLEEEYINKSKQLNMFAQQLEKLLPTEKVGKSALSHDEENILKELVNRMDDLNFIRRNHNVFHKQNGLTSSVSPKLESLVNVLSCCLLAVNSFNIN